MIKYQDVQGWYDWHGLAKRVVMNWLPQNGTYVEVGVWKGKSLIAFGELCMRFGKSATLIGVDRFGGPQDDPTMEKMVEDCGGSFFGETQHNLLEAKVDARLIRDDATAAAKRFENESVDVILIDALHTYEAVKENTLAWMPKLRKGGVMMWHDCDRPEVKQAVTDSWGRNFTIEPPRTGYAKK